MRIALATVIIGLALAVAGCADPCPDRNPTCRAVPVDTGISAIFWGGWW